MQVIEAKSEEAPPVEEVRRVLSWSWSRMAPTSVGAFNVEMLFKT